jgi:hypothetical protein
MNRDPRTMGNHLYVAVLLPFDRQMKVDEQAYRRFLRHSSTTVNSAGDTPVAGRNLGVPRGHRGALRRSSSVVARDPVISCNGAAGAAPAYSGLA